MSTEKQKTRHLTAPATAQIPTKERLTEPEAAFYLRMSRPWLRLGRMNRTGPAYIKQGRSVRYDLCDLDDWIAKHRIEGAE